MDKNTLAHTKWNCKYHIVFAPKYRSKFMPGSYSHAGKYSAEDKRIKFCGISERKKLTDDF